jgi:hypothetical protein
MLVSSDEHQVMFERECRDPQVVIGNGSAGALELNEYTRIVLCRFPARKQNINGLLSEESLQHALVAVLLSTTVESSLDLGENN